MDDELISVISTLLYEGNTVENIREGMLIKGYREEEIFLAIKAGELLVKSIKEKEEELKNRPPPFGRK